ncbi:MAG: hypothetical protein CMJ24_07155 [Phycisphaerae bacterium]|nr:hypothetical protein [Phycisphaerae bacterium]MAB83199.1 hypothetical protein [Phycisphaerae bacterium]
MIRIPLPTLMLMTISLLACVSPLKAQSMDPQQQALVLTEAQQEYDEAAKMLRTNPAEAADAFRASAARFQLLVDSGISNGSLYYDLGNAWYQAGDLGHAIANYLRAERLMPDDPRLDANLAYARSQVRPQITDNDHVALLRSLVFWHDSWTLRLRIWGFGIAWIVLWGALIVRSVRHYPGWNYLAGCAAAISLMLGASALWDIGIDSGNTRGVLVGDQVIVRKGNAESFSPQFDEPINRGVEFEVLEERPDWLHIELGNGEKGWIQSTDAEIVQAVMQSEELTATTSEHGAPGSSVGT